MDLLAVCRCMHLIIFVFLVFAIADDTGNSTSYEVRKAAFHASIQNATKRNFHAQIVLAYLRSFPLDDEVVEELIGVAETSTNSDFPICILVRILFFAGDTRWKEKYDNMILPTLNEETYWFTTECCDRNDDTMASENHLSLWMSSAWLLRQREGWSMGVTLRQRLTHYLTLKIEYGYYEFLSTTYWPFTLQGLMNLIDFCDDEEIRTLAENAARRLVKDNLLFMNNKGIKYSVSGRDYAERFLSEEPYSLKQDGIIYLLTGLGQAQNSAPVGSNAFLSTSSFDLNDIVDQWESFVDTSFKYGHTLEESFQINAGLDKYDRIAFQFSQGAYFHPAVAQDTVEFIQHFAPVHFQQGLRIGSWARLIPSFLAPIAASWFEDLSVGSVTSGHQIHLYRSEGAMLSSVEDFWPGHVGYQSFVWMGVCDDIAVWTQSGNIFEDWLDKNGDITNSYLPFIRQESNVALIMYKRNSPFNLLFSDNDVALYWPEDRFDEVSSVQINDSNAGNGDGGLFQWIFRLIFGSPKTGSWVLGRRGDSYIAVYRPCGDQTDKGWYACGAHTDTQLWVAVVSDSTKHGGFETFASVIQESVVEESSRFRLFQSSVYTATINVDGKTISHEWD